MFRKHVEKWIESGDQFFIDHVQKMLDNSHDTLVDFQREVEVVNKRMVDSEYVYEVDFQYDWSLRDRLKEMIFWYCPEI